MNKQIENVINRLKQRSEPQALSPNRIWGSEVNAELTSFDWNEQAEHLEVIALMAGLHLLNDDLHTSHTFSQKIEGDATGDYWHAIMHRMESDYPNCKYWFHRAGDHPIHQTLPRKASDYLEQCQLDDLPTSPITDILKQFRDKPSWYSNDFVDIVQLQENGTGSEATRSILEELQRIEIGELFDYTYKAFSNR